MARILVVDDEVTTREVLCGILAQAGHTTRAAADGHEALHLHAKEPAELVVTDMAMPGMDGLELISRLSSATPRPQIIALSELRLNHLHLDTAALLGVAHFIEKPFRVEEILETVQTILLQ